MLSNERDFVRKSILYITPFAFTGKRFVMTTLRIKLETLMVCSQTMKGQTSMCKFNRDSYLDLFLHKINVGRDIYLRKDDKSVFRSYIYISNIINSTRHRKDTKCMYYTVFPVSATSLMEFLYIHAEKFQLVFLNC